MDSHIEVYGNCKTTSFEPVEIVLACADYGMLLDHLRWTSWTSTRATAVGTMVFKSCKPNCALGTIDRIPDTRVDLTLAVTGATGGLVWSQIQFNPQPPGYATGPYHGGPEPLPIRPA